MPRRIVVFVVFAVASATLFVRLGVWQLSRLTERRAHNDVISAHLREAEVPWAQLKGDSGDAYRKVQLEGVPDTAHEFVVSGRSRNGSPGVHIITPVRIPGGDAAVLVNRGWVYAADAATAELARWRENRAVFHGYTLAVPSTSVPPSPGKRAMREFGSAGIHALVPYPVGNLYVVSLDSGSVDSTPARLAMPALDDGPHLSYAVQWFSFAAIALAGAAVVARKSMTRESNPVGPRP